MARSLQRMTLVWAVLLGIAAIGSVSAQNSEISERARARIEKEVRHEIITEPFFDVFDNITFRVDGYNVTLMGQVHKPITKSNIEKDVKQIEGVEKVENQIEVLPVSPNDDRIRLATYQAIYGFASLQRYAMPVVKPIRIIVKNGRVTLEGVVNSEADKNVVGIRANSVSGVFQVTNNLSVEKGG